MCSIFNMLQDLPDKVELVDEETRTYNKQENPIMFEYISCNNRLLKNIFQCSMAQSKKVFKNDERSNSLDYFNQCEANVIKMSATELFTVKELMNNYNKCLDVRKSNIHNAIMFVILYYHQHKLAFSVGILFKSFSIIRKYKSSNLILKLHDLYNSLEKSSMNKSLFTCDARMYNKLTPCYYYRGMRLIFRNYIKYIFDSNCLNDSIDSSKHSRPTLTPLDNDISRHDKNPFSTQTSLNERVYNDDESNVNVDSDFIQMCKQIESACVYLTTWIVVEAGKPTCAKVDDYYKIYMIVLLTRLKYASSLTTSSSASSLSASSDGCIESITVTPLIHSILECLTPLGLTPHIDCGKSLKLDHYTLYIVKMLQEDVNTNCSKACITPRYTCLKKYIMSLNELHVKRSKFTDIVEYIARLDMY